MNLDELGRKIAQSLANDDDVSLVSTFDVCADLILVTDNEGHNYEISLDIDAFKD